MGSDVGNVDIDSLFGPSMGTAAYILYELENELRSMRDYLETMEAAIKDHLEKFEERLNSRAAKFNDEECEFFLESYADDHWRLEEVFPQQQRYSTFVLTFALFESRLVYLCKISQKEKHQANDLRGMPGNGIIRVRAYLKKVIGISFNGTEGHWSHIVAFSHIRNAIMHASGAVDQLQEPAKFEQRIRNLAGKGIRVDESKRIQMTADFLLFSIETLRQFSADLLQINRKFFTKSHSTARDYAFSQGGQK